MSRFISPITDMKPNGSLRFFESQTNVVKQTFKDQFQTIANPVEVTVLPNGNIGNVFYTGNAKVLYFDQFGVQYAERDPVGTSGGSGGGTSSFSLWSSVQTYEIGVYVSGSNGELYRSLASQNVGNDPTTSAAFWEQVEFLGVWNSNINYQIGNVVITTTGNLWKSLTSAANNNPETDSGTNWAPAVNGIKIPEIITSNANISTLEALNSWSTPKAANFTAVKNECRQIDASSNTVDVTLPALAPGDSFIYHNMVTSTNKVQILNPTETIKGISGNIAAGTNLEIGAGQSVQMVAVSATILSIVGALL